MKIRTTLAILCAALPLTAGATLVRQDITGTVTAVDPGYSGPVTLSTTLSGHVIYDDETLDPLAASQLLELDFEPDSLLSLNFAGQHYTLADDVWFGSGGPVANFAFGVFTGIDFAAEIAADVFFGIFADQLFIEDDNLAVPLAVQGDVSYSMAPVPLPGGLWLFGSGLGALLYGCRGQRGSRCR